MSGGAARPLASTGAVLAGFGATFVLSIGTDAVLHAAGVFPASGERMSDPLLVLALAYRVAFTVVGGYLTARLAPRRPMRHAMVLAALGTVAGALGVVAWSFGGPALGPAWYPVGIAATAVPSIWVGARLRALRAQASA